MNFYSILLNLLNAFIVYCDLQPIRVLYVTEATNDVSQKSMLAAVKFFDENSELYNIYINVTKTTSDGFVDEEIIPKLCKKYNAMVEDSEPPHIFIDATLAGSTSEAMKAFSAALGLPTVSTSFGHDRDLRQWRQLNPNQLKYLVQVLPPNDVLHSLIPKIGFRQNITNAAVLYDESVVLIHKFKSFFINTGISFTFAPVNRKTLAVDLKKLHSLFFVNFFVIGTIKTIRMVLKVSSKLGYLTERYSWFLLTRDTGEVGVACKTCSLLIAQPLVSDECNKRLEMIFGSKVNREVSLAFHYDLYVTAFLSIRNILKKLNGDLGIFKTCDEYYKNKTAIVRTNIDLMEELRKKHNNPTCGTIQFISNGFSHVAYEIKLTLMKILNYSISEKIEVGSWHAGLNTNITTINAAQIDNFTSYTTYRVVVVESKPYIFKDENHPSGYNGYCLDLLDELAKRMRFRYNLTCVDAIGEPDENGKWGGLIGQLMNDEADLAFALYVTAARQEVIDFTVPITDLEGINILVRNVPVPDDFFKFVHVFENEVWICIILAYFITSLLMWIFTNFKPWYLPSLDEKITSRKVENGKIRMFTLTECLWFCLASLTALGGEQAPYKFSSRLVAATWYIFAFIMTCTYTANLAAVSTTSREKSSISSLVDLSKQYKMQFAPVDGSFEMQYFKNRAYIEKELYKVWEKMSLNDSLPDIERSKLAVFEYPFPDTFSDIWTIMEESGFPKTLEEGLARVKNSSSSSEGFALVANSGTLKYCAAVNCDLIMVGEEFALKPVAIALPNNSPLRKALDEEILEMVKERITDVLKEKWWDHNPERITCPEEVDASDGMTIHTMGGIFLLLFTGIFIALLILGLDYCLLRIISQQMKSKKKLKVSKSRKK